MKRRVASLLLVVFGLFLLCLLAVLVFRDAGAKRSAALGLDFPTVMAHRGASFWAPEEMEIAYRLAQATQVDFLEADIQRSQDGVLLALHDDTLERTTNVGQVFPQRAHRPVSDFTWAELSQLDAGSWFNHRYPDRARTGFVGAKLLPLERLIDVALSLDKPTGLYLETKSPERFPGLEQQLVAQLARRGYTEMPGKIVFQSFSADSLRHLARLAPSVPRIYLISEEMVKEQGFDRLLSVAQQIAQGIGPVGYYAYPTHNYRAHRRGLVVHTWTVNLGWQLRLLRLFGADGVFTDRCDLAMPIWKHKPARSIESLWQATQRRF